MQPGSPCFSESRPDRSPVVLVADGDAEALTEVATWLEALGYAVVTTTCGNDAIRVIKRDPVDLVVTEVIMANGDGLELMLEYKRRQPAGRVIAISAGGRYLPAADCLRVAKGLGAHETMLKPLQRLDVIAAVERLLGSVLVSPVVPIPE